MPTIWPPKLALDVVEAGRIAGGEDADPDDAEEARQPWTATAPTASSTRIFVSIQPPM